MNDEEKKAVEKIKEIIECFYCFPNPTNIELKDCDCSTLEIVLNLIEKLQKENKELKNSLIKLEKELVQNAIEDTNDDISDENNIKYIELVFENCECIRLYPDMFKDLVINRIMKNKKINCFQYENGECWDNLSCSYFAITILQKGCNQKMNWINQLLKERLQSSNDIVSICLTYNNGEEEYIYVPWDENNDYINEYQKTQFESDSINIEIKEE